MHDTKFGGHPDVDRALAVAAANETYRKGMELWLGAMHQNGILWHEVTARTAQAFIDALQMDRHPGIVAASAIYQEVPENPKEPNQVGRVPLQGGIRNHHLERSSGVGAGERRRDELIFEAGRYMGLRRKEITGLKVANFLSLDPAAPLNILWTDPAFTKGRKTRPVLVPRLGSRDEVNAFGTIMPPKPWSSPAAY